MLALLERREGSRGTLVTAQKLCFGHISEIALRPDADITFFIHEKAKLIGKIEIGLVVGRCAEQDDTAVVLFEILLECTIGSSLSVP